MSKRWMDDVPQAPGGLAGAWFNAIICGAFVFVLPIGAFTTEKAPTNVFLAIALLGVSVFMETVFIRKLRQQLQVARERGDDGQDQDQDQDRTL